ncbi:cadherin-like beta sandwich domain-containing protein, partial [Bacteroidales bacterium OttesenSCG-928-L14]|nr:cadherin-like beta sandwich domain-containing protein [Bacteroidales bacterium OttesenSCG-928-L14]
MRRPITLQFLKFSQTIILFILLFSSTSLLAQQQIITFEWAGNGNQTKSFMITLTSGTGTITVSWGDEANTTIVLELQLYHDLEICNINPYNDFNNHEVTITADVGTDIQRLEVNNKQVSKLDVSRATALAYLQCNDNQLTSLDISKNFALEGLDCSSNQLTSLDVSNNIALEGLGCSSNQLTSLEVSNNIALVGLGCSSNQIKSLDVSNNVNLIELSCSSNQLTSLDVSNNTALAFLSCSANQLTSLDVSNNTALIYLYARDQTPTMLQETATNGNLSIVNPLYFNGSAITDITGATVSGDNIEWTGLSGESGTASCTFATTLPSGVSGTAFSGTLNQPWEAAPPQSITFKWAGIGGGTEWFIINATTGTNNITVSWGDDANTTETFNGSSDLILISPVYGDTESHEVVITAAIGTDITRLHFTDNRQVSEIDVSGATALTELTCYRNPLISLNVNGAIALQTLNCYRNQLTDLDVSGSTALQTLNCYNNQLTNLDVSNNAALTHLACEYNQLTSLEISNNTDLSHLNCSSNQLTSLDVSGATALTALECSSNQLTSLDVSGATALQTLSCHSNQLTSLEVNNITALEDLACHSNQLTSLDISNNTDLIYLECYSNQLTSLDISNNTDLIYLECYSNQLTSLDISNNTDLSYLNCSYNAIPLAGLKDISDNTATIEQSDKYLGTQILPTQIWNDISATIDDVFYGEGTTFIVSLDGVSAISGTDYSIYNGNIIFMNSGLFEIEITNPSGLISHPDEIAKVIASYDVTLLPNWIDYPDFSWYIAGEPYVIATPNELAGLAAIVNNYGDLTSEGIQTETFENKTITLVDDINLSGKLWSPIGSNITNSFQGVFSGDLHTISNMEVDFVDFSVFSGYIAGLFGYINNENAKVENLNVEGEINVSSTHSCVGGIAGNNFDGTIQNCTFTGDVNATAISNNAYSGGLVGYNQGHIKNCKHTGNVSASYTGSATYYYTLTGGIAGANRAHTITNSSHIGNVSAYSTAKAYSGGITGWNYHAIIRNSYARGVVQVTSDDTQLIGGIAGYYIGSSTPIQNNYFEGELINNSSGILYKGGIVGQNELAYARIQNNYWKVDGVIDAISSNPTNNYPEADYIGDNLAFTDTGIFAENITVGEYTGINMLDALNAWATVNQTTPPLTYFPWETRTDENDNYPMLRPFSTDASLSDLAVGTEILDPSFDSETYEYEVIVDNNVSEIIITATASHANATIEGNGLQSLEVGGNTFDIVVTAEDC